MTFKNAIKPMITLIVLLPLVLGAVSAPSKKTNLLETLGAVNMPSKKTNILDDQPVTDASKALPVFKNSPQFSIKVVSNPTTGYHWYLTDYDPQFVVPMSHQYYPPRTNKLGAGGYNIWVFKVTPKAFLVPHLLKVGMRYTRPFQVNVAHDQNFFVATSDASMHATS